MLCEHKYPQMYMQHFSLEDFESFVEAQLMNEPAGGRNPRKLKPNAE